MPNQNHFSPNELIHYGKSQNAQINGYVSVLRLILFYEAQALIDKDRFDVAIWWNKLLRREIYLLLGASMISFVIPDGIDYFIGE